MQPSPAGLPEGALQQAREHVSSLCAQGNPVAALAVRCLHFAEALCWMCQFAHLLSAVKLPSGASYSFK